MTHPVAGSSAQPSAYAPPTRSRRRRAVPAFYLALAVLMTVVVFAGFWRTYFGQLVSGVPVRRPWFIHMHAAVFLGWMALLFAQATLVFRRRTPDHRALGRIGIAYGALVLVMGLVASIAGPLLRIGSGEWTLDQGASFLALPLGDMLLFGTLFGAAVAYRRKPEIHKRLIVLATVAILFAPAARLGGSPPVALAIWLVPLLVAIGYDLWIRRRVHKVYLIGAAFLLAVFARVFVMETEGWRRIGRAILGPFLGA